jgi:hypothetical protein
VFQNKDLRRILGPERERGSDREKWWSFLESAHQTPAESVTIMQTTFNTFILQACVITVLKCGVFFDQVNNS